MWTRSLPMHSRQASGRFTRLRHDLIASGRSVTFPDFHKQRAIQGKLSADKIWYRNSVSPTGGMKTGIHCGVCRLY